MRRLKAPLKQHQGAATKNTSGASARPQSSCGKQTEATNDACGGQMGASENGDFTEAAKAQQAEEAQIQAAVAKRARFESNRSNLGNFERAYPVEVETVTITATSSKVCFCFPHIQVCARSRTKVCCFVCALTHAVNSIFKPNPE